ncbi:MAG: CoA-binding protein [Bacteroidia bacterium]
MKTLVLGATPNADRFAYRAVMSLLRHGHEVVPVGRKKGEVGGLTILNDPPQVEDIHTITLYLNPTNQQEYYDYIINLKPKRIIFNPGTENEELERRALDNGIEIIEGCTLVMLSVGHY